MNPLWLLQGGGILARLFGQGQIDAATRQALIEESRRQSGYGRRAREALNRTIEALSAPASDYESAVAARTAAAGPTISVATQPVIAGTGSAPTEVRKASARTLSNILNRGAGQIRAASRAGAGGQQLQEYAEPITESGRKIAMMTDFSRGSNRALQSELQRAQQAGAPLMTLGDIMSGAGLIYGLHNARLANPLSYPSGDAYGPATAYYGRKIF